MKKLPEEERKIHKLLSQRAYRERNRERLNARDRNYRKEHLEACRAYGLAYYYKHKKERLDKDRIQTLTLGDGRTITGLNKRPYPNHCEVCTREGLRLSYHHWDDNDYNTGIWVCLPCHRMAECIDKGLDSVYLSVKANILRGE